MACSSFVIAGVSHKPVTAHLKTSASKTTTHKIQPVVKKPQPQAPSTTSTTPPTQPVSIPVQPPKTTKISTPAPSIRTSTKVEPVVAPAPTSSVSGLTPTAPSTSSSTPSPTSTTTTSSGTGSTSTSQPQVTSGYTSSNWSGYFASGGTYTSVSASWKATSPTGNGVSNSADSTWIGIGGITSSDLIQMGTENTVSASGQVSSAAFYELLPNSAIFIPSLTITPGDSITCNITEQSANQWTMSLTDNTTAKSFSISTSYTSTNSSVEWIEEDPSYTSGQQVPMDNFVSVNFSGASTVSSGTTLNLNSSGAQPITLVNSSGQPVATPSTIGSDNASFSITQNN